MPMLLHPQKAAMRDLEIRGAGSLLGMQQHGHIEAVGYDLYCKMLNDAVLAMKGGRTEEEQEFETTVDMDMDAFIPSAYIKSEFQKLDMYKRIAGVDSREELMDIEDELTDRYGVPGTAVRNLLMIAYIKSLAHTVWVSQVQQRAEHMEFVFHPQAKLDASGFPELIQKHQGHLKLGKKKEQPILIYTMDTKKQERPVSEMVFKKAEEILLELEQLKLGTITK